MSKSYKAPNKKIIMRSGNGRFRKTTFEDVGISTCPECHHFMVEKYFGKDKEFLNPKDFGWECLYCGARKNRRGESLPKAEKNLSDMVNTIVDVMNHNAKVIQNKKTLEKFLQ